MTTDSSARIVVDRDRCTGIGICESIADDYFEVDDDGTLELVRDQVPHGDLERLREAVRGCPARALTLTEQA
ncbi:ferredoxin [Streptomyces aurantiogriseus]|uniref:Ferredoxin n=1 Tax=Streptomyces aurantiogriseus TaxID=66870 RepID=A0A918KYR0_9ACTN|nr:ferredoxin [Streptomyces aurantiogriseus]GGR47320.1 ferredoxin [Streptomyces aurantiogriseus]